MKKPTVDSSRLVALFLLGCLLFNYPILYLFSADREVQGIPLLFAYLFVAWLILVALLALAVERRPPRPAARSDASMRP